MTAGLLNHLGTLSVSALLLLAVYGCDTTGITTLEENRGAYQDAREFLDVGRTTAEQVRAKFGTPTRISSRENGDLWQYTRTDTVQVNAYTNTPYGTDASIMGGFSGYQHTVVRKTMLEMLFDSAGILTHYRIYRDAP